MASGSDSSCGSSSSGSISAFLAPFRVDKGHEFTHTSMAKPAGSFYVPTASRDAFFDVYKAALARGDDLFLTERHRHIGPVVVDFDFRYDPHDGVSVSPVDGQPQRLHTHRLIRSIVEIYAAAISEIVDVCGGDAFECFVLEKPSGPTIVKGVVKDGVHLIFPSIVTRPEVQLLVRLDVLAAVEAACKEAVPTLLNRVDDVVDEAVIERNNWMMYGSKKCGSEPYRVTARYSCCRGAAGVSVRLIDSEVPEADLVTLLSIRNKLEESPIRETQRDRVSDLVTKREEEAARRAAILSVISTSDNPRTNTCDDLEQVQRLVEILAPERLDNYSDWIRLGWCLRNIDHRLLDTWIDFSKRSPKYVEGECPRLWNSMRSHGLGVRTLHMWARHDSPEKYREVIRQGLYGLVTASITGVEYDVACVVYHMYRHEFVCSNIRTKTWYAFRDHRWRSCDSAHALRKHLSIEVFAEYLGVQRAVAQRAGASLDEAEQKQLTQQTKKLAELALKLKSTKFKDNVIRECAELFYSEHFENKLDSNGSLVGFENGVLDLERLEFREGRPDDYVSFSTGINHIQYVPDHPCVQEINRFWESVHPDPAMREYVLLTLSSCLSGTVREEKFYIWTGSGCHAKGTQIMMFDGSTKVVEDVAVGDVLMGDDSNPRNVQQLFRGHADMWRVVPTKGEPFVVNGDHILSLVASNLISISHRVDRPTLPFHARWFERAPGRVVNTRSKAFATEEDAKQHLEHEMKMNPLIVKEGDVIDVTVKEYVANVQRFGERNFYLYRPGFVEFQERPVHPALHPYVLGAWLGDGSSSSTDITSMDAPIVDRVRSLLPESMSMQAIAQKGQASTYSMTCCSEMRGKRNCNELRNALKKYDLLGPGKKHIPLDYRCNSREIRMQVLAGIIDTDGTYQKHTNQLSLTLKSERLIDDTIALARSLGFACYKQEISKTCCNNGVVGTYFRTNIVGKGIEDIPLALEYKRPRERVKNKNVNRVGFKLERVEDDDYYGFELDGNHRYLMGDYTVTHNSNAKSVTVNLIEKTLGDYCCKFPVTLLTNKRAASGAATPEIARAKGRRFAVLQEPGDDERLNVGLMKELSGGDVVQTRELFKPPTEWKPQFKLFLLCNQLPQVPSDDGGTWRRIRVVEFGSKFVERPDPNNPREFPMDPELHSKLEGWREHFAAMLIEAFKRYIQRPIHEPAPVTACTRDYQRTNDHLADFIDSCIEKTPATESTLRIDQAYAALRDWARAESIQLPRSQKRSCLVKYLDRYTGRCQPSGTSPLRASWPGLRLRQGDADVPVDDLDFRT
jgi:P4 family phage/plasmid primase-like protien